MAPKAKKSRPYDASKYLDSAEGIAAYVTEAFVTQDLPAITHALGVAAKARGMTQIAEQTGLACESLYKALSLEGNSGARDNTSGASGARFTNSRRADGRASAKKVCLRA